MASETKRRRRAVQPLSVVLFAAVACAGCARSPRALLPSPPRSAAVAELLAAARLPAGENIRVTEIGRGASASLHLIQIRDRETPHLHARYDLTVTLASGRGTLWLNGRPLRMRAGDVAFVARRTPHHFVNQGSSPAAAIVSFSPPFDGPDQEAPEARPSGASNTGSDDQQPAESSSGGSLRDKGSRSPFQSDGG